MQGIVNNNMNIAFSPAKPLALPLGLQLSFLSKIKAVLVYLCIQVCMALLGLGCVGGVRQQSVLVLRCL